MDCTKMRRKKIQNFCKLENWQKRANKSKVDISCLQRSHEIHQKNNNNKVDNPRIKFLINLFGKKIIIIKK